MEARRQESLASLILMAFHDPKGFYEAVSRVSYDTRTPEQIVASTLGRYGAH